MSLPKPSRIAKRVMLKGRKIRKLGRKATMCTYTVCLSRFTLTKWTTETTPWIRTILDFYILLKFLFRSTQTWEYLQKVMSILNSFVNDFFERIASEAYRLAKHRNRRTITQHDIQTAVRLILPGDLAKYAFKKGGKTIINMKIQPEPE